MGHMKTIEDIGEELLNDGVERHRHASPPSREWMARQMTLARCPIMLAALQRLSAAVLSLQEAQER